MHPSYPTAIAPIMASVPRSEYSTQSQQSEYPNTQQGQSQVSPTYTTSRDGFGLEQHFEDWTSRYNGSNDRLHHERREGGVRMGGRGGGGGDYGGGGGLQGLHKPISQTALHVQQKFISSRTYTTCWMGCFPTRSTTGRRK